MFTSQILIGHDFALLHCTAIIFVLLVQLQWHYDFLKAQKKFYQMICSFSSQFLELNIPSERAPSKIDRQNSMIPHLAH